MPAELLERPGAVCPKHMEYGPCGGVEFDGSCEVASHACVFLEVPTVRWRGSTPRVEPVSSAGRMRDRLRTRTIVVADFPAAALSATSIAECAAALAGSVDAVLAGDAGAARVQFPPAYRAQLIMAAGLEVWSGLNCRDRNRVALEGELAALAQLGVAGIHAVTGDHTLTGSRPDAAPVFDLDSTELAALAAAAGLLVSVAEAPATPPVSRRPARLLEKQHAGAELCFVNHCGGVEPVRAFVDAARALGVTLGFIPCIPIVVDRESAELLTTFTTLVLPPGYLEGILAAPDVRAAGIEAAVALGRGFLALEGVVGVNLSGGAGPGGELAFAEALAEIGSFLRSSAISESRQARNPGDGAREQASTS